MRVSPLTLHRLSVYLRCLRQMEEAGVHRVSSQELADRFDLSATQIRKDLAQFGEFGIRGVGYDVARLTEGLHRLLGLDQQHRLAVVGMGSLGSALARHLGPDGTFAVVAGLDNDPRKVGTRLAHLEVRHSSELPAVVRETGATIGVLTVPADAAQVNYEALVVAGIRAVLNFAPARLKPNRAVPVKDVDFRINLEELVYFLK